jgi:arylsulfatase
MIEPGQQSDGLFNFSDLMPTALTLAGAAEKLPRDRYIDGVDQAAFLLVPGGLSHRKYHYYWLMQNFSAIRCGEYKMVLRSTSDDGEGHWGPGGFTGIRSSTPTRPCTTCTWTRRKPTIT